MGSGMYTDAKEQAMATQSLPRHKHLRIDQVKLDKARRLLEARTETETLDRALALVVAEGEIDAALRRLRGRASLKGVFR
jgi:hypothetical protein